MLLSIAFLLGRSFPRDRAELYLILGQKKNTMINIRQIDTKICSSVFQVSDSLFPYFEAADFEMSDFDFPYYDGNIFLVSYDAWTL